MTALSREMVEVVDSSVDSRTLAIKAVRALLREFGGQLIYFPATPREKSNQVSRLRSILEDEIGGYAQKVVEVWTKIYGGSQIYLPLEYKAFRDEIADEIYERYDGKANTMNELCKEFRASYVQIYRLYYHGQKRKNRLAQPDLFL